MADLWTDRNQPLLRAYYAPSKLLSTFPTESPSIFILCRWEKWVYGVKWPAQVYTASNWQSSDLEQSLQSACNAGVPGDLSLIPGSGRSPGGGNGNLLSVFLPGKTHGQRSLVGYSPWGPKESARLSAEFFPSKCTSRYAMLLGLHHWNTFHVFPCNLYCLFVHPTADNTVLSTTEESPIADLLRLYACPPLEKQGTTSDQVIVAPFTAAYADRGPAGWR